MANIKEMKEKAKKIFKGSVAVGIILIAAAIILLATIAKWGTVLGYIAFGAGVVGMFCLALAWIKYDEAKKLGKEVPAEKKETPAEPAKPADEPAKPADEHAPEAPAPVRKTRKSLREEADAADDQLVEAEIRFRDAEKRDDDAKAALKEYEELLAAARARRARK